MTNPAAGRELRCPTCPDGRCPSINSTPVGPEPSPKRIAETEVVIPDVLAELFELDGRHEAVASSLVEALEKAEFGAHRTHVAKWAIHCLIQKGMLSVHALFGLCIRRDAVRVQRRWDKEARLFRRIEPELNSSDFCIYGSEPAAFETFIVRAEESLWQRWRA